MQVKFQRQFTFLFGFLLFFIPCQSIAKSDTLSLLKTHKIADSLFINKEYKKAVVNYEKAVQVYHRDRIWEQEVVCLNGLGDALRKIREYDKAIEILNKSLDLGLVHLNDNDQHLAKTFHLKGLTYLNKGDYYKAGFSEMEAVKRWKVIFGDESSQVAKGYNNIGLCYKNTGRFNEAGEYFKKALKINENILDSLHPNIAMISNNLSVVYKEKGDYDQALKYSKRAIGITLNSHPVDSIKLAKRYNNIGMTYIKITNTVSAYKYYKSALDIRLNMLEKGHPDLAESYNNIGRVYKIEGRYDLALEYYNMSLEIYDKIYSGKHPDIGMSYSNISSVYKEKGDFDKAIFFNSKAFDIWSGYYRENHPYFAICYQEFGDIYDKMGNTNKALKYLALAINANTLDGQPLSYNEHLEILTKKAKVYINRFDKSTNDTVDLIKAISVFKEISVLVDKMRKSYKSKGSMMVLSKQVSATLLEAIRISYILFEITNNKSYIETAFFFTEKNKANVLVEAILESRSQTSSGILDSLIQREKEIKSKLRECNDKRKAEIFNKEKRDHEKINKLEEEFSLLNNIYDSLIKVFEKNYQNYFLLKYSTTTLSAKNVQQSLSGGVALVEYVISDSLLFIFTITNKEISITKVKAGSIDYYVSGLRKSLSELNIKNLNNKSARFYCDNANHLYNLLIRPIEDKIDVTDIIIIPDGKLGYIPFEVLLTEKANTPVNFKQLPYLLKKYSVSYGNSATIQFDLLKSLTCSAKGDFLGIAPFVQRSQDQKAVYYNDTLKLVNLISTKHEIRSIQKQIEGKAFEGSFATKQNFLNEAANYKILHIATHGVVDDEHPLESSLFFYQDDSSGSNRLKISDLFGLTFNSELAVLSACNTGYGKLEKGEGIMSLARGFSYAGVPAITMSLWNVNDRSTSKVMGSFYYYLKEGYLKNEALRQAQLDYIEGADQLFATPYYWGGFVFIGRNDAIDLNDDGFNYWFFMLVFPILFLAIHFYFRQRK